MKVFPCSTVKAGLTHYQAIVTEKSAIQKKASHKIKDITDVPESTLLFFESSIEDAVPWMSPQDVDWNKHISNLSKAKMPHPKNAPFAFADGAVRFFPVDVDQVELDAASTISGGEKVSLDFGY